MENPSDVRHSERLIGIVDDVASFGRRLRAEGLMVGPPQLTTFARALGLTTPQDAYWVGRAVLTTSPAEIPAYDRGFPEPLWIGNPIVTFASPDDREDPRRRTREPRRLSIGTRGRNGVAC